MTLYKARRIVTDKVKMPAGYAIRWSGQYEAIERVRERLKVVAP